MSLYSNKPVEITIAPGCPWYDAQIYYGTPNVDWCEPTVCAVINEPANTWSNLPFLLIGLWVWTRMRGTVAGSFGIVIFLMGLLSGIYHATNNRFTQHLDFMGMSLMTSFLLAFVTRRILKKEQKAWDQYFWFYFWLNVTIVLFLGVLKLPLQTLLLMNMVPLVLAEINCNFFLKTTKSFYLFVLGSVILVFAQIMAQIDLKRIYCEPQNLVFHGHVAWHILCAVAMIFASYFISKNEKAFRH